VNRYSLQLSRRETWPRRAGHRTTTYASTNPIRRLITVAGSLELTTIGLLWLFGLVLAGTFHQLAHSIQETTAVFFHSWLVYAGPVPLPAGQLVLAILGLNLIVSAFTRIPFRWSKVGLFIIHLGLILLVIGGLTQRFNRRESVLVLAEGESDTYSYDLQRWDLITSGSEDERYPLDGLPPQIGGLPVVLQHYLPAAALSWTGGAEVINSEGARSLVPSTLIGGNPVPGVVMQFGNEMILLHGADRAPTVTESGMELRIQPSRYPMPVELQLEEFTAEFFPGSDTPKAFTSRVRVTQGDVARTAVISMNEPLRLRDYTVYQLGYDDGGRRDISVFQVVQNPLRWVAYVVTLLISAGLFVHLIIRLIDVRRRQSL
jgi:ResB-like family protein